MRSFRWIPLALLVALISSPAQVGAQIRGNVPALPDTDPPIPPLPHVSQIVTVPAQPNDQEPTSIVVQGTFPFPCGEVFDARRPMQHSYAIGLRQLPRCNTPSTTWRWRFDLGRLAAGHHTIQLAMLVVSGDSTGTDSTRHYSLFSFNVARGDSGPPPPQVEGLRYVDSVSIAAQRSRPNGPPICPGDSIAAVISGVFPNTCWRLRDIKIVPSLAAVVGPPMVWLQVDSLPCGSGVPACAEVLVPWRARVVLPPLPASGYRLQLMQSIGVCGDSVPPRPRYFQSFPFEVARNCSTTSRPCVFGTFLHPRDSVACDATVAPGRPASVTFAVYPGVPLSGLQGALEVQPAGLRITGIEPVRAAAGMKLTWTPAASGGARFVLFAHEGAPIPASPWMSGGAPVPILRVTVSQSANSAPASTLVYSSELLGADERANAVPRCEFPPNVRIDPTQFAARICRERDCDFNGDGRTDVRDLVLMVRCLRLEASCGDSANAGFVDCNGDGRGSIDDVLCCAWRILGVRPCIDCGDSSAVRSEPGIALDLKAPAGTTGGLAVPMRLRGSDRVGALRLVLDAPFDRYDVAAVELGEGGSEWLQLHEVQDGRLVIGLVRLSPAGERSELDLTLELALKAGQRHGGSITASEAQFSGPDGVALEVELGRPTQGFGGGASLALSPNRPNPFTGETVFSVTLDRGDDVTVGVYDVSGRLVASVFRGPLAAGTHEFGWSGRSADGSRAANGIYFYRASTGATQVSRKMILMRGN